MPFYCSPTALQRLFHHDGERAVAAAAAKYGTMFGVSSLGTVIVGATAVIRHARAHPDKHPWIMKMPAKKVAVALANKTARIAWAILAKSGTYRAPALAEHA